MSKPRHSATKADSRLSAATSDGLSAPLLPADGTLLRRQLLAWYDRHRRILPWRAAPGERSDPYVVLVSEIMLQQTTVATVQPRFERFLRRFPSLAALADAPLADVLHEWAGLGYYRRARGLHACANLVRDRHGGVLPDTIAALRALPGLGPYTAAAIGAIAFGLPTVPVDGNVERVLARLGAIETPLPQARRQIDRLADALAAAERAGDVAQALMELGALVCTPRNPLCLTCPWQSSCRAAATGDPTALPRRAARGVRPERRAVAFMLRRPDGAILLRERPAEGLLGGMIELPASPWHRAQDDDDADDAAMLAHAPACTAWNLLPGEVVHVFTHFALRLRLAVGECSHEQAAGLTGLWTPPTAMAGLALPTLTHKLLRHGGVSASDGPASKRRTTKTRLTETL